MSYVRVKRSASQVLFGYLPEQTVDLNRGIWKVKQWRTPTTLGDVDHVSLVRELKRAAAPWRAANTDGGFCQSLDRGATVSVLALDRSAGVQVERFPDVWFCSSLKCHRVLDAYDSQCPCGFKGRPQQFHFVGYCDKCGAIREPYAKRCVTHRQVKVTFPGTASAAEIIFSCPVCQQVQRQGFGMPKCACGGVISFTVHRAASVFTPRSVVIVNPPSRTQIAVMASAGGPARALEWVLGGMTDRSMASGTKTSAGLRQDLLARGFSIEVVEAMIKASNSDSHAEITDDSSLIAGHLDAAQEQAVTVALAVDQSRTTIADLVNGTAEKSPLGELYRTGYSSALNRSGLEAVELLDQFPVLTGHFGYTRGKTTPGQSRLVAYRERRNFAVYGEVAQTEALFVRLDPLCVVQWLRALGFEIDGVTTRREARLAILQRATIPTIADNAGSSAMGEAILTLVHSYAHRFIRIAAVLSGIDRSAMSELLVPLHLGFFVYAAAKGDFVLGGLQALFESELELLLNRVAMDELRCPMDPGAPKLVVLAWLACTWVSRHAVSLIGFFHDPSFSDLTVISRCADRLHYQARYARTF